MKAMTLTGIEKMQMAEVKTPDVLGDKEVLIKMEVVAVCGSDVHYYKSGRIGSQVVQYPFTVGHECAGTVDKVGKRVTRVKVGDRIAIEPAMPCFECDQCRADRTHTCRNLNFLGCPGQASGSLSEYMVMPESSCYLIPDSMSFVDAAISEPLSIGLYAVKRAISLKDAKIGILGFGPIGMSVMLAAKAYGATDFYITDKIDHRLDIAKAEGATQTVNINSGSVDDILQKEPLGMDVVFECCGKQEAMDDAMKILKPGGSIMLIGIPEFDTWQLSADIMRRNEVSIINIRRQNECVQEALDLIASGKIEVSRMPTHYFKFDQTQEAFELVKGYKDGVMKAIIEF